MYSPKRGVDIGSGFSSRSDRTKAYGSAVETLLGSYSDRFYKWLS